MKKILILFLCIPSTIFTSYNEVKQPNTELSNALSACYTALTYAADTAVAHQTAIENAKTKNYSSESFALITLTRLNWEDAVTRLDIAEKHYHNLKQHTPYTIIERSILQTIEPNSPQQVQRYEQETNQTPVVYKAIRKKDVQLPKIFVPKSGMLCLKR